MNAIIAIKYGRPASMADVFLRSVKKRFDGPVMILTDRPDIEPAPGVDVHQFVVSRIFGAVPLPHWYPKGSHFFPFRWALLHSFVQWAELCAITEKSFGPRFDAAWFLDLRDGVLQGNPFDFDAAGAPLAVVSETPKIGQSDFAGTWLNAYYGPDAQRKLADGLLYCAGAVWGTREGLLALSRAMIDEHRRLASEVLSTVDIWDDQAILNWLIHHDQIPARARSFHNGRGPVFHLGETPNEEILQQEDGIVLPRGTANVPAILHQYDRHPGLKRWFEDKYNAKAESMR